MSDSRGIRAPTGSTADALRRDLVDKSTGDPFPKEGEVLSPQIALVEISDGRGEEEVLRTQLIMDLTLKQGGGRETQVQPPLETFGHTILPFASTNYLSTL